MDFANRRYNSQEKIKKASTGKNSLLKILRDDFFITSMKLDEKMCILFFEDSYYTKVLLKIRWNIE